MRLIDEIGVEHASRRSTIQLFIGDLAALPAGHAVDLLIVSAFPGSYKPTPTSLIGALERQAGVSVNALANDKAVDLRRHSSCWLSQEIRVPGIPFRRILCFEPAIRGRAPEIVGDIFRSIIPFAAGLTTVSRIAMPIVASGDQGESKEVMLDCIVRAALHWLSIGMPIDCIKIVERDERRAAALKTVFERVRAEHTLAKPPAAIGQWRYDAFVSYSRLDKAQVDRLVESMLTLRGSLRIFVDQMELQTGAAWQQHIYEALDDCRKVITMLSPNYLSSKVCKEEFNIALFRHRESADGVLLPVYLRTPELPTYMKLIQFEDAREGDPIKVAATARNLTGRI